MHLTAPSHWSRSIGTGGRDPSERVVTIVGIRNAPLEIADAEILATLRAELRADFERDRIVRFAVAYPGLRIDPEQPLLMAKPGIRRVEVVGIEAHNAEVAIGCHREVIRRPGRPPLLGTLSPLERLTDSKYGNLLSCCGVS